MVSSLSYTGLIKQESSFSNKTDKEREYNRKHIYGLRSKLFDILGRECKRCKFSDMRALQIDFINGGHVRILKQKFNNNVNKLYKFYVYQPELTKQELQTLCANCNWIKRHENNENRKIKRYRT